MGQVEEEEFFFEPQTEREQRQRGYYYDGKRYSNRTAGVVTTRPPNSESGLMPKRPMACGTLDLQKNSSLGQ
jgi:hypothetical protein